MQGYFKQIPILIFLFLMMSLVAMAQSDRQKIGMPYFSVGVYSLDNRSTANGLDEIGNDIVGLASFGGGYEFFLNDSWSLGLGADLSIGGFEDEYSEQFLDVAYMQINLTGFSFNLRPKYNIFETTSGGFFLEGIGKLESFASKARFVFYNDEEDFSTAGTTSGFHFYWGGSIGYHADFENSNAVQLSLGVISHDFGKAVNKLDLEQSGYFVNEHLKRGVSLEARLVFYFSFKRKIDRLDTSGFNSFFFNRDEQVRRQLDRNRK
jgi:hypothetical protein